MLDRESVCNRVFLARRFALFGADGVGLRFEPARSFFKLAAAPRSTMSSPLPYCRTSQTSSDARYLQRNSSIVSTRARARGDGPFGLRYILREEFLGPPALPRTRYRKIGYALDAHSQNYR
jgi:hypothetical protein